jgi:hypothetical protein
MSKFNILLTVLAASQLIVNISSGQATNSPYLVKPMNEYSLSDNSESSKTGYYHCESVYAINKPLNEVWDFYTSLDAKDAWNSDVSKFVESYDKAHSSYHSSRSSAFDTLGVGKVFLVELHFLKYITLPVIFQITKVDRKNRLLEFTYMKENRSNGFQQLQFEERNGVTFIKHTSYYRSGNKFRDWFIYPRFHREATDDFHKRIFLLIKRKARFETGPSNNDTAVSYTGVSACADDDEETNCTDETSR